MAGRWSCILLLVAWAWQEEVRSFAARLQTAADLKAELTILTAELVLDLQWLLQQDSKMIAYAVLLGPTRRSSWTFHTCELDVLFRWFRWFASGVAAI